uniref:Uncharacterized protein n=1 Tax=Rhizophora mucronata TaxID=61149 RepID=A0A2P2IJ47_RHIMU
MPMCNQCMHNMWVLHTKCLHLLLQVTIQIINRINKKASTLRISRKP